MKNTIIKDTIILTLITLVSGGLLGLVYQVTKEPIAQQEELAKQEAYQAVFEDADSFEVCVEEGDTEIWQTTVLQTKLSMKLWRQRMLPVRLSVML